MPSLKTHAYRTLGWGKDHGQTGDTAIIAVSNSSSPKEMMTAKRSYCLTPVPEGHKPTAMYFAQMAELITIGLILFILLCFP